MRRIAIDEAQARLPELFREALDGAEVMITGPDGSAVRMVPATTYGQPRFGSARGMFAMADDFGAPLTDFAPYVR